MICLECLNSGMTTKTYFSIPLEIYEPLTTEVTSVRVLVIKLRERRGTPFFLIVELKLGSYKTK